MVSAKELETCLATLCVWSPNHAREVLSYYRQAIRIFLKE